MELVFVNYQLAWSGGMEHGGGSPLSFGGRGEGEGLFRATGKRAGFKPLTSILSPSHEGRGEKEPRDTGCRAHKDVRATP